MKISIGPLELNLKDLTLDKNNLEKLRGKLRAAGAPELLSERQWLSGRSSIPRQTGSTIRHIPSSAGFARGRPIPARAPTRRGKKHYEPPKKMKVVKDEAIDEEFQKIPELDHVFEDCLKSFPEVKGVEIRATKSNELVGMKGNLHGKPVIILFVPEKAWGKWQALRPIILHEICHFIDLENPDKIFEERADEKSKELWAKLDKMGQIRCEVGKKEKGRK